MKQLKFSILLVIFTLGLHASEKPNFIIIFTDDQGYNDLGCFGSKTIKTPHIDRIAQEGRKLTSFYAASSICTPSRAALLTGCYPKRVGLARGVIFPGDNHGLHPDEVTIADMLKGAGYATACIGKWHLGHRQPFLPTSQGFDAYFGIPYSNDMNHPDNGGRKGLLRKDDSWLAQGEAWKKWQTPLMQDEDIVELPVNQRTITRRYTDRAIEFVTAHKDEPFFLYLPHSMPHVPLFVPEDAYDPDPQNAYKAVIEHIDAEVGRLMKTVSALGLNDRTYVIFTSDNGPWLPFENHAGSAAPLRAGKMTTYEGGQRVPCIIWGPGRVPAGTESNEMATTMDLLPTLAKLSGAKLEPRGPIDGLDISNLIHGTGPSPRKELVYYSKDGSLHGLRQGDWKLRSTRSKQGASTELFNLVEDIGETTNLAREYPDRVQTMHTKMRQLDNQITDSIRPHGQL